MTAHLLSAQLLSLRLLGHAPLAAPRTTGSSMLWYLTRATGVVSLVLLTATVVLGVVGTARAASQRWPRLVTAGLHRNLALASAAFVIIHILTTVLDPYAAISPIASVIPFSSAYRPLWLSLGTFSFDLLLAILITSLLRDRLGRRLWQGVHLLVYLSWPAALWHGLGTGTDTKLFFLLAIDVACVAAVVGAVAWRLLITPSVRTRAAGLLAAAVVPLLTLGFVVLGPLQPGWARRAGTPASLLGKQSGGSSSGTPASGQLYNTPFTAQLAVSANPAGDQRTITITGHTTAAPKEPLLIVLRGTPAGAGVALSGGQVQIGQPGSATGYSGPVTMLNGAELVASVSGQAGQRRAQFVMTINGSSVTGTVSLLAASGE